MAAHVQKYQGSRAMVALKERERREAAKMDMQLLVPEEDLQRPPADETAQLDREVWDIMQSRITAKQSAAQPKSLPKQPGAAEYVKYKPAAQRLVHNSGAKARVIQMQEMAHDPLDPPRFRIKKVPRAETTEAAPVLHSPPRPVTAEERAEWNIPPCISNWKNPKGYTIPLDKRLAADGRGLVQQTVNDKQAALAEALYTAEQNARKQVELTHQLKLAQAQRVKEQREAQLRDLAIQARREKKDKLSLQGRLDDGDVGPAPPTLDQGAGAPEFGSGRGDVAVGMAGASGIGGGSQLDRRRASPSDDEAEEGGPPRRETREEREARREREDIRYERKREREREHRLDAKNAHGNKKSRLTRDRDRDVSERVALGMANVGPSNPESMYDSRLFNQDAGVGSGLATDDAYNIYDKAWQADRSQLYKAARISKETDGDAAGHFRPDRGFEGADYANAAPVHQPVEFEKGQDEDVFGLDEFLKNVQK